MEPQLRDGELYKYQEERKRDCVEMVMLEGKVAIVTGGSSGIGRATALAFSNEGAKVAVADINDEGGEETVEMIRNSGGSAIYIHTDVSMSTEVEKMVSKTVETYGRLDCAFNNAGITTETAAITECTEENWDRVNRVNLKGVWLCMKYEIPAMIKQSGGAIVNTSSIHGLTAGTPGGPAYVASKHGIIGITKNTAMTYRKAGIRVNAVCPGAIRTPILYGAIERAIERGDEALVKMVEAMEEDGLVGDPEYIANAVVWLCSEYASFITGQSLVIDGGYLISK
jgi:NAD(P)-dependent dehydrogenase (short-subunit alcohol dehydrogenase family)